VQPLREFFVARYLFSTAPQSSPGKERSGSRPDRFDAIARNFYWFNVTRFYAGFYSKGELPSLVERLSELSREAGFRNIQYPRLLAATLLSDWVFSQNPRSVQQVVDLIVDGIGVRLLAAPATPPRQARGDLPQIPAKCGREEILDRCFRILSQDIPKDFALEVIALLRLNSGTSDVTALWLKQFEKSHQDAERVKVVRLRVAFRRASDG
jgi:hypothetical protein